MNEDEFNNPPSPYGHPLKMVDRVESLDIVNEKMVGRKALSRNEPLLQGHFPAFLILPGILQLEAMAQLSAMLLKAVERKDQMTRTLISESRIKHMRPVLPGDTMVMETRLILRKEELFTFRVRATVDNEEAAKGQIVLRWLDSRLADGGPQS